MSGTNVNDLEFQGFPSADEEIHNFGMGPCGGGSIPSTLPTVSPSGSIPKDNVDTGRTKSRTRVRERSGGGRGDKESKFAMPKPKAKRVKKETKIPSPESMETESENESPTPNLNKDQIITIHQFEPRPEPKCSSLPPPDHVSYSLNVSYSGSEKLQGPSTSSIPLPTGTCRSSVLSPPSLRPRGPTELLERELPLPINPYSRKSDKQESKTAPDGMGQEQDKSGASDPVAAPSDPDVRQTQTKPEEHVRGGESGAELNPVLHEALSLLQKCSYDELQAYMMTPNHLNIPSYLSSYAVTKASEVPDKDEWKKIKWGEMRRKSSDFPLFLTNLLLLIKGTKLLPYLPLLLPFMDESEATDMKAAYAIIAKLVNFSYTLDDFGSPVITCTIWQNPYRKGMKNTYVGSFNFYNLTYKVGDKTHEDHGEKIDLDDSGRAFALSITSMIESMISK